MLTYSIYAAGLTPYDSESGGVTPLPLDSFADTLRESGKPKARLKPVSFDDYFTLWKGIATSIHGYKEPNECKCEFNGASETSMHTPCTAAVQ